MPRGLFQEMVLPLLGPDSLIRLSHVSKGGRRQIHSYIVNLHELHLPAKRPRDPYARAWIDMCMEKCARLRRLILTCSVASEYRNTAPNCTHQLVPFRHMIWRNAPCFEHVEVRCATDDMDVAFSTARRNAHLMLWETTAMNAYLVQNAPRLTHLCLPASQITADNIAHWPLTVSSITVVLGYVPPYTDDVFDASRSTSPDAAYYSAYFSTPVSSSSSSSSSPSSFSSSGSSGSSSSSTVPSSASCFKGMDLVLPRVRASRLTRSATSPFSLAPASGTDDCIISRILSAPCTLRHLVLFEFQDSAFPVGGPDVSAKITMGIATLESLEVSFDVDDFASGKASRAWSWLLETLPDMQSLVSLDLGLTTFGLPVGGDDNPWRTVTPPARIRFPPSLQSLVWRFATWMPLLDAPTTLRSFRLCAPSMTSQFLGALRQFPLLEVCEAPHLTAGVANERTWLDAIAASSPHMRRVIAAFSDRPPRRPGPPVLTTPRVILAMLDKWAKLVHLEVSATFPGKPPDPNLYLSRFPTTLRRFEVSCLHEIQHVPPGYLHVDPTATSPSLPSTHIPSSATSLDRASLQLHVPFTIQVEHVHQSLGVFDRVSELFLPDEHPVSEDTLHALLSLPCLKALRCCIRGVDGTVTDPVARATSIPTRRPSQSLTHLRLSIDFVTPGPATNVLGPLWERCPRLEFLRLKHRGTVIMRSILDSLIRHIPSSAVNHQPSLPALHTLDCLVAGPQDEEDLHRRFSDESHTSRAVLAIAVLYPALRQVEGCPGSFAETWKLFTRLCPRGCWIHCPPTGMSEETKTAVPAEATSSASAPDDNDLLVLLRQHCVCHLLAHLKTRERYPWPWFGRMYSLA
jgi:hypothetical protein